MQAANQITFIFDLDNVLIHIGRRNIWKNLLCFAWWDFLIYWCFHQHPRIVFFKFLEDEFGKQEPVNPQDPPEKWFYATRHNLILPKIWCDYEKGLYTHEYVLAAIDTKIDRYFNSARERRIMRYVLISIFNPNILTSYMKLFRNAVPFIQQLAQEKHTLCILSNFSSKGFDKLFVRPDLQPVFQYFKKEHCFISSNIGFIKPQPEIYDYLKKQLKRLNKELKNCVFIDDNTNNIIMARKAGITAILKEKHVSYATIRKEINNYMNEST